MSLIRTDVAAQALAPGAAPAGYGPADLQSAYRLPSATAGAGQTVAIVDAYDYPSAESDLATYRSQFGLPPCTTANGCFRKVNQDGQESPLPEPDTGWAGEQALDIDMVSAVCPRCRILVVEANSNNDDDLFAAVATAVHMGARFESNSWGDDEASDNDGYAQIHLNYPGVAITASSGDSGYGLSFPASSRFVTSVGGTTLFQDDNPRGWSERAWTGAGSGCSAYTQKATWQHDSGCANRTVADVSAVADPASGVAVYDSFNSFGWSMIGGTSVAAPIIASVYALAGTPAADTFPASFPYANPGALFDVTSGSNGTCGPAYLCTATAGYDGPTGLGTPNGTGAFTAGGTQPPPSNLALHRPATGSRACQPAETPDKAVNGSVSGGLDDKFCSNAASQFLQVDLGSVMSISRFTVRHAGAGGESAALNTRDYDLAVSTDGKTFTTVAKVRGNTANVTDTTVTARGRYIRLNTVTPTQTSDPRTRIYEFEAYGVPSPPPGNTNLALHRPATGSTPCSPTETPDKAVNGSVSGGNSDKFCSLVSGAFLQVDLGSVTHIGRFVVRHAGAGGEQSSWNTVSYDLAVSTNGTSFTTVAQVCGNTSDVTTTTVDTTARFIRINVRTPTSDGDPATRIYEFEAYS